MPNTPAAASASPIVIPELLAILHKLNEGVNTLGSGIDELRNLLQSSIVDAPASVSKTAIAPNQGFGPSDTSTTANVNIALGRDDPTSSHINDASRQSKDENTDITTSRHAHGAVVDPESPGKNSGQFENDTISPPFVPTTEEVAVGNNTIDGTADQPLFSSDHGSEVLEDIDIPIANPPSNHSTSARDREVIVANSVLSNPSNSMREPSTLDIRSAQICFRGSRWVKIDGDTFLALPGGGKLFLPPEWHQTSSTSRWMSDLEGVDDVLLQHRLWQMASSQWESWLKDDSHTEKPVLVSFDKDNQYLGVVEDWKGNHVLDKDEGVQVWLQYQHPCDRYRLRGASMVYHIMYNIMYNFVFPFDPRRTSFYFLDHHIGPWLPINRLRSPESSGRNFQYRLRMFKTGKSDHLFGDVGRISHCRDKGRYPMSRTTIGMPEAASPWFYEKRVSLLMLTNIEYTSRRIVVMDDGGYSRWPEEEFPASNLTPEDEQVLQLLLRHYHTEWEKDWHGCLDEMDISTTVTLEDITDDAKFDTWMFDGPSLDRSRIYFAALQQLRIFSGYIKETVRDVEWILEDARKARNLPSMVEFWEGILTPLKDAEGRLLNRIDKKTEDIKTLRDGLFNSTSVREATRSTQMNRYVIVFTIVTVLYTPPSFVSTLLATPYFTKRDPDELKQAIAIATGATIVAVLVFLALANSFNNIFEGSNNLLRSNVQVAQKKVQKATSSAREKVQEAKHLALDFFQRRSRGSQSSNEDIEMRRRDVYV